MSRLSSAMQSQRERQTASAHSMYSVAGASFQEDCLHIVGSDKSFSKLIGQLVTSINNSEMTIETARRIFNDAWFKSHN